MTQTLQAGVATSVITPAVGTRLFGFGARPGPAESVRDHLQAAALVVSDGKNTAAVLTCDLCIIHPSLLRAVRTLVATMIGLAPQNLLICASHTHSGPVTYVKAGGPAIEEAYLAHLPYVLAGVVGTAARQLQPAHLRCGHATSHIGVHRRQRDTQGQIQLGENEQGPTDPAVSVLSIEGTDGRLLGTLVNYACHPVILGPQSLAVSADFVGAMRRRVEDATGAPVLFVQGACASTNPRGTRQIPAETLVETLGLDLAKATFAARAAAVPVGAAPIVTRAVTISLPTAANADEPDPQNALPQLSRGGATTPPHTAEALNTVMDERFPWSWESAGDKDRGKAVIDLDISLLRCGDIAILGLSCEPFVETALAIKAAGVFPETLVAGYSNGCFGYLPPAYTYAEGGYEVAESYRWFRLPAPPQSGSAERVAAEAIALLRDAAN